MESVQEILASRSEAATTFQVQGEAEAEEAAAGAAVVFASVLASAVPPAALSAAVSRLMPAFEFLTSSLSPVSVRFSTTARWSTRSSSLRLSSAFGSVTIGLSFWVTETFAREVVPESSIFAGFPPVGLRKTKVRLEESFASATRRLSELSAGTMRASSATSRAETLKLRRASSVVPKGFVEPVASIWEPLSLNASSGVTRLSEALSIVETKGSLSVRSVSA